MAHLCFSCRKQAWNSAAEEAETQESLVLLQEPGGPWALPFYPRLGDPFQHRPEFLDSLSCFCGLSRWNCSGCGHLFKESCDPCSECPEPQPTAWTPMDPKAAAGEAEPAEDMNPRTIRETEALGTSQETEARVSGGPPALLPAQPFPGLPP